jgi:hypothetical protein
MLNTFLKFFVIGGMSAAALFCFLSIFFVFIVGGLASGGPGAIPWEFSALFLIAMAAPGAAGVALMRLAKWLGRNSRYQAVAALCLTFAYIFVIIIAGPLNTLNLVEEASQAPPTFILLAALATMIYWAAL